MPEPGVPRRLLRDEAARAPIGRAMPLLDGPPEATVLRPVGGKGF